MFWVIDNEEGDFCICFAGIASVRCHITRMTSWYNVKGARIGKISVFCLLCFLLLNLEFWFCIFRCLYMLNLNIGC